MGQGASQSTDQTNGLSSEDLIKYGYAKALVEQDIPRLKQVLQHILKSQELQGQVSEFCQFLFQNDLQNMSYKLPQNDNRLQLASSVFTAFFDQNAKPSKLAQQMKFETFVRLYAALTRPDYEEQFELLFKLFAKSPPEHDTDTGQDYLKASWFQTVGLKKLGLQNSQVQEATKLFNTVIDKRIYKFELKEVFESSRESPFFSWLDSFNEPFLGLINAQDPNFKQPDSLQNCDTQDFTHEEIKVLDTFFEQKIANQTEIQNGTKQLTVLLSDRSINLKLRNRITESFLYASNSNFFDKKVYFKIMKVVFKELDENTIISYIFDIFTKYSPEQFMNNTQINEVIQVFKRASEEQQTKTDLTPLGGIFSDQIRQLEKVDRTLFMELFKDNLDFWPQFNKIRTVLYVELEVRPETGVQERHIVKTMLDQMNFVQFADMNMEKGDSFYILNKRFYDQWFDYVRSKKTKIDTQGRGLKIENECLFKSLEQKQLHELKINDNFVIVPPRIWSAFVGWYGKSIEIKRYVIEYQSTVENIQNQRPNNIRRLSKDQSKIIELEIDLISIKAGQILENGKQPQTGQIVDISPKMTLMDVQLKLCKIFQITEVGKTQLWMKEVLIQGEVLDTLVEQNKEIKAGKRFFIEELLENQRWPTDDKAIQKEVKSQIIEMKTVGCFNLGNTCYFNSVLQCVTNTHYFKEYFLRTLFEQKRDAIMTNESYSNLRLLFDQQLELEWKNQINVKNPMGFEGNIVRNFAKLTEDLYTSKFACAMGPRKFKAAMGRHFDQFSGNQQQDAQEFLVILLDSLHEELNVRMVKPYIEKPGSSDRDERELSLECWSNFLHRNWSFISFLFYGQMRSLLKCQRCGLERVSFDEYSTLSLPLPESSLIKLNVVIQLIPEEIKLILIHQEDMKTYLERQFAIDSRKQRTTLNFDSHEQTLQSLTKERPILLQVAMMPSCEVKQITGYLQEYFKTLHLIPQNGGDRLTEIVYYLMSEVNDSIHIVIPPDTPLNLIREGTYIQAIEVLTMKGKQLIQHYYESQMVEIQLTSRNVLLNFKPINIETDLRLDIIESSELEEGNIENKDQKQVKFDEQNPQESSYKGDELQTGVFEESSRQRNDVVLEQKIQIETVYYEYAKYQLRSSIDFGLTYSGYHKKYISGGQQANKVVGLSPIKKLENDPIEYIPPSEFLVYFISRKIVQRDLYLTNSNRYHTKLFGKPLFVMINRQTTGRELYEEVWMRARFMLNFTHSKFQADSNNFWWNQYIDDENRSRALANETQFSPFVIKFVQNVTSTLQLCSICLSKKCFGCPLDPSQTTPLYEQFQERCFFAIDWNLEFLQQYYQPQSLKMIDIESFKDRQRDVESSKDKRVELTDCLKMFEGVEDIFEKEGVNCEKCHVPTHHTKKMGVSRAPPILIIHLKRFKIINGSKKKIDQYVHYPLYDLNMTPYLGVHGSEDESKDHQNLYDLYGVINHFGGINSGHYLCYVKNDKTQNWFQYDDSYVKPVVESKVHSQFAYILFYKRRDLSEKPLDKIYKTITLGGQLKDDWFKGKPVRVKKGYGSKLFGYIWDKRAPLDGSSKCIYHVKIGSMDLYTTLDMLDFDADKDNLNHLLDMESVKLRQKEMQAEESKVAETKETDPSKHLTKEEEQTIRKKMKQAEKEIKKYMDHEKKEANKQKKKKNCSQQ